MVTLENIKQKQEELNQMIKDYEEQGSQIYKDSDWYDRIDCKFNYQYYYINFNNIIHSANSVNSQVDQNIFKNYNAFKTKKKAEEISKKQLLWRKIQKFADENNECKIDWNDDNQQKYSISYGYNERKLSIYSYCMVSDFNQIYFTSKKIAQHCINTYKEELLEYFTEKQ